MKPSANFVFSVLITGAVALLSACNTQSIRSSGMPSPGATTGSAGIPGPTPMPGSTSSGSGTGRPPIGTGQSLPTGTGADPRSGSASSSAGRPGTTSSAGAATAHGTTDRTGTAGTDARDEGESDTAGKSDDEILAEALEALSAGNAGGQDSQSEGEEDGETTGAEITGNGDGTQGQTQGASGPSGSADRSAGTNNPGNRNAADGRLATGLAEFDDMIRGKHQETAAQANTEGAGPRRSSAGAVDDEGLQTVMLDRDPPPTPDGSEQGAGGSDMARAKPAAVTPEYEIPDDVGNGQDDDIIAKQLREAAMKEKDPELRAKLWEEYRKYKKDLQART